MEAVAVFYNQPYFNRDYIAAALHPLPPWRGNDRWYWQPGR
jgi:hypothetical protein